MRDAWLAAVFAFMVACGSYSFPGEHPSPASGTVSGHVISVPCKPIVTTANACAGRPVAGLEIDYLDVNARTVSHTVTNGTGDYSIQLGSGGYAVKLKTYMRVISGPLKVDVKPGSSTVANYVLDNGIRVPVDQTPVPQQ